MRHGDPPPFTGREEMPRARRHTAPMPSSFPLDFFEHVYYTLLMNELLTRTICIKLDVDGHEAVVQEAQRRFNEAASWIATVCWDERITNSNTAHHRVYGQTRSQFGLGAQLAVCARAKAMEAIKGVRKQEAEKLARWRKANARRQKKGKKPAPPPARSLAPARVSATMRVPIACCPLIVCRSTRLKDASRRACSRGNASTRCCAILIGRSAARRWSGEEARISCT